MATLAPSTPPPSPPLHIRRKSWARRLERCCCTTFSFFPLVFVYGLTSWAVYVEVNVSFFNSSSTSSYVSAALGLGLYLLANISYTIAVFTTPGSPLDPRQDWRDRGLFNKQYSGTSAYSALPTFEPHPNTTDAVPHGDMTTVTAKSSTGAPRYCKKCHTTKPDRTHHCSTCGRCVLKMDHHCPWLATCVGLHNYKAFLLFLCYTSIFCWVCFFRAGTWVWTSIGEASRAGASSEDAWKVVNTILLAVLGGIIGLVLSGFTAWHIYLALSGQTTIESLEKTRYLSPLRKNMEQQLQSQTRQSGRHYLDSEDAEDGQRHARSGSRGEAQQSLLAHLKETHANALPGVLRPEEGESTPSRSTTPIPPPSSHSRQLSDSPAKDSLQNSYATLEARRERDRWLSYQDELASEKLPNAFDLGWRRNLSHIFGPHPWLWALPICNTTGDGWAWEVSPSWTAASAEVAREREARAREEATWGAGAAAMPPRRDFRWTPGQGFVNQAGYYPSSNGNGIGEYEEEGSAQMQMQPLDRRKGPPRSPSAVEGDNYDTSSDEDAAKRPAARPVNGTANWNDIPDGFLSSKSKGEGGRSHSRGRRKGD